MSSNREELFKKAKEEREQDKKNEKERKERREKGGTPREYDEIAYLALETGFDKVVRLLGSPKSSRTDAFSPKDVNVSMILGDNDKPFRCIWPLKEDNPNWILWKIYNTVMTYKWDKTLNGGKGGRIYDNASKHPSIFNRIAKNNKPENTLENGWYPKTYVIQNVIDRQDMEWHKQNKHTKLLSKKVKKTNDKDWYDPGYPSTLYNTIWDEIVEYYGDWENYDVAIRKESDTPWYRAFDTSANLIKIQEGAKKFIVNGKLTDEEKSWERYDIDALSKVTSYQKIKKNLGILIQQIDAAFNKSFTKELDDLVEEEKIRFAEIYGKKEESKEESKEEKKETTSQTPPPARRSTTTEKADESIFNLQDYVKEFPGIDELTDAMKSTIIGYKDKKLVYKKEAGQVLGCVDEKCPGTAPDTFSHCPKCAAKF